MSQRTLSRREFVVAASTLLAGGCRKPEQINLARPLPERPNIIVWLADSLRADRLPCYGCPLDTAPHISAFAQRAAIFDACYSAATWTLPATLSLLTGLPPLVHRTVVPEWSVAGRAEGKKHQVLPPSIPTTAKHLSDAGYDTAHFQSNPNATREHGIDTGFNHYYYQLNAGYEEQTTAFLEWLRTEAREPFYAYIHLIDPHEPYSPAPEIFRELHGHTIEEHLTRLPKAEFVRLQNYHRQTWDGLFKTDQRPGPEVLTRFSRESMQYLEALYTAEIRGMDGQFGRMLAALDEQGLRDRCIVAVTSDHGEAFGEDGLFYHGSGLHDAQIHVPLVLQLPGMLKGTRYPHTVSQYDIHPTLLALAGVADTEVYGRVILGREGEFPRESGRPVLTSLDLNEPDPDRWRFRLTAGDIRVENQEGTLHCAVSRAAGPPNRRWVALEEVEKIPDEATRTAVEYFYTERHYLKKLAAAHAAPTWFGKSDSDDEALKALGYL